MYAAYSLLRGDVAAALREWNHAIDHAYRLPLPRRFAERMREIQERDLLDPEQRMAAVVALLNLSSEMGVMIAASDPSFDDFASPPAP